MMDSLVQLIVIGFNTRGHLGYATRQGDGVRIEGRACDFKR
jgi:hypothetical protein